MGTISNAPDPIKREEDELAEAGLEELVPLFFQVNNIMLTRYRIQSDSSSKRASKPDHYLAQNKRRKRTHMQNIPESNRKIDSGEHVSIAQGGPAEDVIIVNALCARHPGQSPVQIGPENVL